MKFPSCSFVNCPDEGQLEVDVHTFLQNRATGPMIQTKLFRTGASDMLGVRNCLTFALMAGE